MRFRCEKQYNKNFSSYGGRGITVCEEWKEYFKFKNWAINNGYKDNLSIDRIDVNGNYESNNCRWATPKMQSNNTRVNHLITINGITKTAKQWEEHTGIKACVLIYRHNAGWSEENLLIKPDKTRRIKR